MCGYLKTVLALLAIIMLAPQTFAADPGHAAPAIGSGMFESGNYTFPDTLHIQNYLNVSGLLWVDPITSRVGIGTTTPANTLDVRGEGNFSGDIYARNASLVCLQDGTNCPAGAGGSESPFTNDTTEITPTASVTAASLNFSYDSGTFFINPATNRVGIGTATPGAELEVVGTGHTRVYVRSTGTDNLAGIKLIGRSSGSDYSWYIDNRGGTESPVERLAILNNLLSELFTIQTGGNVGIGTANPSKTLEVVGTAAVGDLNATSATVANNVTAQDSVIATKAVYGPGSFVVDGSGNVGIGDTAPTSQLSVTGNVNATGGVRAPTICVGTDCRTSWPTDTGTGNDDAYNPTNLAFTNESNTFSLYQTFSAPVNLNAGAKLNVTSCDTVDTSDGGVLVCGTDATGNDVAYDPTDLAFTNISETFDINLTVSDSVLTDFIYPDTTGYVSIMGGNVGIGTTAPGDAKLNVSGTIDAWQVTINGTAVGTGSGGAGDLSNYAVKNDSETFTKNVTVQDSLITDFIYPDTTGYVSIMGGNVGIGTTGPIRKFHVEDSNAVVAEITSTSSDATVLFLNNSNSARNWGLGVAGMSNLGGVTNPGAFYIRDETGASPKFVIENNTGNVGIGTTAPTHGLNVFASSPLNVTRSGGTAGIEVDSTGNVIIRLG